MQAFFTSLRQRVAHHITLVRLACFVAFVAGFVLGSNKALLSQLFKRHLARRARPIVVFAVPDSSTVKDTFMISLARDFNFQLIAVGPWLASLSAREDDIGALVRKYTEKRARMPAKHLVPLLRAHMNELRDQGAKRFLIDGRLMDKEGMEMWDKKAGRHSLTIYLTDSPQTFADQSTKVIRKRFDSVSGENEWKFVSAKSQGHEAGADSLLQYLESSDRLIKITAPDDSNKSYAKVLNDLRKHPKGRELFR